MKNTEEKKTIEEMKKIFIELHYERVKVYENFEKEFKNYLKNKIEKEYNYSCIEVSKKFQKISKEIIIIEQEIKNESIEISECIRNIQNLEKEKLKLTIEIQLLEKEFSFKNSEDENFTDEYNHQLEFLMNPKQIKISSIIEEINQNISIILLDSINDSLDID
jgi:hypothetical protein